MARKGVTRHEVLKLGAASAASALLPAAATAARRDGRKNILFITVDQLRSLADVPAALPLPNIYGFRRGAWNFENYHVNQAPCGPSRSVIYTGQHVQKTGVYTNPPGEYTRDIYDGRAVIELPPRFPTLGTMLREQGYYTAYKGKWHLSVINQNIPGYPYAANALDSFGFSDYNFDGEVSGLTWEGYGHDGVIAADAVDLLRSFAKGRTGGKPWFFAINFINPHDIMYLDTSDDGTPLVNPVGPTKPPPGELVYDRDWNFPMPRSFSDDLSTKPAVQRRSRREDTLAKWKDFQNYYFNCIRDVDRHVGMVLKALDQLGLAQDTIVVFSADHGEMGGAHGLKGKGAYMYKECLRVPLVVRHPDVPRGGTTKALASAVDLTPTFLSWAGMSEADRAARYPYLKGVDLSRDVGDARARSRRDEAGILFNYMTPSAATPAGRARGGVTEAGTRDLYRGIFDGRYKFARYFGVDGHNTPTDWASLSSRNDLELYDTQADPDEVVNLANDPARRDTLLALNTKLNAMIAREVGVDDASIYRNRVPAPPPANARPPRGGAD